MGLGKGREVSGESGGIKEWFIGILGSNKEKKLGTKMVVWAVTFVTVIEQITSTA